MTEIIEWTDEVNRPPLRNRVQLTVYNVDQDRYRFATRADLAKVTELLGAAVGSNVERDRADVLQRCADEWKERAERAEAALARANALIAEAADEAKRCELALTAAERDLVDTAKDRVALLLLAQAVGRDRSVVSRAVRLAFDALPAHLRQAATGE